MPVHPALKTMRILWFALFMAVFLYMGIVYGVLPKKTNVPLQPMMPPMLGVMSLVVAALSFFLPRMTYQQAAKAAQVDTVEEVVASAMPSRYREAMPKRLVFAKPNVAMDKAFVTFQAPFILSIALSEAVALFGFVLAQIGFELMLSLPFFLAGAVLIAIRFPQQEKVLAMFEQARGASFPAQNG